MDKKSQDTVRVVNVVTGGVDTLPRRIAEHPVFGKSLVEVKPGTKPHTPELYSGQTVEDYTSNHPGKLPDNEEDPTTYSETEEE